MLDLGIVKNDFSCLIDNIHPWMLSHFVMWLDIKVAEYKVYGHMVLDDTQNDTPSWLSSHTGQKTTDGSYQHIPSLDNDKHQNQKCPEQYNDENTILNKTQSRTDSGTTTERSLPSLTRYSRASRRHLTVTESEQTSQNYEALSGNDTSNQEHSVVQNIQLQEQWSKEIEKSLQLGHAMAFDRGLDHTASGETRTDPVSRSTIVLTETVLKENSINDRNHVDSSSSVDDNSIKIEPDMDLIKIEVSSDDGLNQYKELDYVQDNRQTDFGPNSFAEPESDIQEVSTVLSSMMSSLENTETRPSNLDSTGKKSSWKSKKWDYFERLRKTQKSNYDGARVHSRSIQDKLPFPKPFPLKTLTYGLRALHMISSGVVTRPGKMQFLDAVFNETVKYTGLYPTPQQKLEVAEAICTTFPKLDARNNPGQGSSVTQWLNILKDKFRNERRMLHHGPYLSRQRIPGSQYSMTSSGTNGVS